MKFLKEIYKRPLTIAFVIIIMLVLGIFSTSSMTVNLLPNIEFPYLTVQTIYAGASAEVIDKKITTVLQNDLSTMSGIHSIDTYSLDNASVILLQFDYGTNIDKKEEELEKRLAQIELPSDCSKPEISDIDFNNTAIYSFTMYSQEDDMEALYQEASNMKTQIQSIDGVGDVSLVGSPQKTIEVETINGLEMLSGLLVKEIAENKALDIPLGEIDSEGNKITINNDSGVKTVEEIQNMQISATLENDQLVKIQEVQTLIKQMESMTSETLHNIKDESQGMLDFIDTLETSTNEERNALINNLTMMKTLTNLLETYSATSLQFMWDNALKTLVESESFKNMTDEQLQTIAKDFSLSYELLKWLQINAEINPETNVTYAEEKWAILVNFKTNHPDVINDEDYIQLLYDLEVVSNDVNNENYMSESDILDAIKLSRIVNTTFLNNVVTTLNNGETPTNAQYASIFTLTGSTHTLPVTATTLEFIRDPNFMDNLEVFYQYKLTHEHIEVVENEDGTSENVLVADPMPSQDFVDLLNQMTFSSPLPVKLTAPLVDFIRNLDATNQNVTFKASDIASVELTSVYSDFAYYNSKRAIQIDVYANSNGNASNIARSIEKLIDKGNESNKGITIVSLNNQADFINDSLVNALVSLLIGMFLAVAVIYLFLRKMKSSLIIAISMPLSVLCTLFCLYLMGITLNMVSVGGIAVGIGMLVDNSIVVLESITSEKAKGKSNMRAAVDGVKLVLGSLIGSTLTSVCVFFPILFINGLTKEIFADLSWAVIFSLSFSLLVAILIIPTLFCLFYRRKKNRTVDNSVRPEGKFFTKIKNWYLNFLKKALKHKKATILASLGIFAASIALIFACNIEFMPTVDQHTLQLTIKYEYGDDPNDCQKKTYQAYELIENNIENVEYISQSIGMSGLVSTTQTGTILVKLTDKSKATKNVIEDIRNVFIDNNYNENYEIMEIDGIVASLTGGLSGISVSIYGEDVDTLKEISKEIQEDVLKKEGIRHYSDNMLNEVQSYTIKFDLDALKAQNIDYQTLVQTLRIGLAGYDVAYLDVGNEEIKVNVSWREDAIGDYYDSLDKFVVGYDTDTNPIYLENVAEIQLKTGRNVIRKSGELNVLDISIETFGIDTNTASKYLQQSTDKVLKNYPGYESKASGVSYYLSDAFGGLVIALIISFFLLFGVMACLFESLRKPLIIIFSLPFAFTGAFIALAVTRVSLNIVSFIGLIMLMGVIINDAIVLNERFNQLREEYKMDDKNAIINGCSQRLRAVLMTTLTTVLALIPMALGLGQGGTLMQPLGIVAIGGMTVGTLATLIIIPCAYALVYRIDFGDKKTKTKKRKTRNLIAKVYNNKEE